jgi:hypothetical protein
MQVVANKQARISILQAFCAKTTSEIRTRETKTGCRSVAEVIDLHRQRTKMRAMNDGLSFQVLFTDARLTRSVAKREQIELTSEWESRAAYDRWKRVKAEMFEVISSERFEVISSELLKSLGCRIFLFSNLGAGMLRIKRTKADID